MNVIGFAMCGSFCTLSRALEVLRILRGRYDVVPIVSSIVRQTDTRFGTAADLLEQVRGICGHEVLHTIPEAEPLGPRTPLDALVICPCTGNTLAKLACGITDTPVTMAAKAHLRSDRPLLITLASNDAMSANLGNMSTLLTRKNVFFTPLVQDDPVKKPHSLVADFSLVPDALTLAMRGEQMRPLFR